MSDIGGTGKFDAKKISGSKPADKKNTKNTGETPTENNHRETHLKQIRSENQGRYLNASDSQKFVHRVSREKHIDQFKEDQHSEDEDLDLVTPFKAKEEKEKALIKNPLLKSKLDLSPKISRNKNSEKELKAKPPKPSLKSLLAPKGNLNNRVNYQELINLNPQLKKVSSINIDNMQELNKTLEGKRSEAEEKQSKEKSLASSPLALTDIFNFEELFKNNKLSGGDIHAVLESLWEEETNSPQLREQLQDTLQNLRENEPLNNYLLLNLPYPFPLYIKDIDLDFENILDELEEENEQASDDEEFNGEKEEEEENSEEFIPDTIAALAVETYNFGKILVLIKYSESLNKFELSFKGDINGEELAIAMGSNIEFALPLETNIKEKRFRTWKNKSYGHIDPNSSRHIQTFIEGNASPIFLETCKTVMDSVLQSDQRITDFEKHKGGKIL